MRCVWLLLVPVAMVLVAPAQARPRDDALAGAFRCSVIAESRVWLDCYYGAVQPVRTGLGMPPALAAQIKLANAPPSGGQARDETVRDDVMSAAAGCIRVTGERPWLDCYYAAAAPMRTHLGLSGPPVAPKPLPQLAYVPPPARTVPAGPPPMPRNSGMLQGMFGDMKPIVRNVPMRSFTLNRRGAFTVTLADGQVWAQLAEDEIYHPARWGQAGPDKLVTIAPGPMHTFVMRVADQSRSYKVRRLR
ncbi:MAG: hypothetical protein ABI608_00635 [Rhizomicrobium sp.]